MPFVEVQMRIGASGRPEKQHIQSQHIVQIHDTYTTTDYDTRIPATPPNLKPDATWTRQVTVSFLGGKEVVFVGVVADRLMDALGFR